MVHTCLDDYSSVCRVNHTMGGDFAKNGADLMDAQHNSNNSQRDVLKLLEVLGQVRECTRTLHKLQKHMDQQEANGKQCIALVLSISPLHHQCPFPQNCREAICCCVTVLYMVSAISCFAGLF